MSFFSEDTLLSVVVTSRLTAPAPLHRLPCIDQFVEIRGFDIENIKVYIQSEFISDQKKAIRAIREQSTARLRVCAVSLLTALLFVITLEEALPTELYTKIIINIVVCKIQKK